MRIFLSGGIGDVFALESMMCQAERNALTTIYWACKASKLAIPLFRASKRYGHVEHIELPDNTVYFNIEGLRKYYDIPSDVDDWSVSTKFQEFYTRTEWNRSTFLEEAQPIESPASRYVLIQHQTPLHTTPEQRRLRDLDGDEWALILERLEAEDLVGVVVNSADTDPPPDHPRIINMVGKTTFSESISLLNQAVGYWGIASALIVLAAQRFAIDELWVKGPEFWLWANRPIYLAPHRDFHMLHQHLCKPTVRSLDTGMQIMMTTTRIVNNQIVMPGSIVDVTPKQAEAHIRYKEAIPYVKPAPAPVEARRNPEGLIEATRNPVVKKAAKFTQEGN